MTDKELIKQEIERKMEDVVGAYESEDTEHGYKQFCKEILSFIDSIPEEPARVDLEEAVRYYLLNNHISPLSNILHRANLKVEMQYHKDIEEAYKAGAEWQKQQLSKCLENLEKEYIRNSGKGLYDNNEIAAKLATLKRIEEEMKGGKDEIQD